MMRKMLQKFLIEAALACSLAMSGLMLVLLLPYDKQFGYSRMLESCGRGDWLYNRIFENKTPIDIAFIGSSRTICGVNDSLLESCLNVYVANLGFCRYGRSLHYALFKDLLRKKSPKTLVLEVHEEESRSGHPDFSHIADMEDLLLPVSFKNWLMQLVDGVQDRVGYHAKKMLGDLPAYDAAGNSMPYHFVAHPGKANAAALAKVKNRKTQKAGKIRLEPPWSRRISKKYLWEIVALAMHHQVEVKFLYLPSYGALETQPAELEFYKKYGEVLLPPAPFSQSPEYRVDEDHLNDEGAMLLTEWLAGNL